MCHQWCAWGCRVWYELTLGVPGVYEFSTRMGMDQKLVFVGSAFQYILGKGIWCWVGQMELGYSEEPLDVATLGFPTGYPH